MSIFCRVLVTSWYDTRMRMKLRSHHTKCILCTMRPTCTSLPCTFTANQYEVGRAGLWAYAWSTCSGKFSSVHVLWTRLDSRSNVGIELGIMAILQSREYYTMPHPRRADPVKMCDLRHRRDAPIPFRQTIRDCCDSTSEFTSPQVPSNYVPPAETRESSTFPYICPSDVPPENYHRRHLHSRT